MLEVSVAHERAQQERQDGDGCIHLRMTVVPKNDGFVSAVLARYDRDPLAQRGCLVTPTEPHVEVAVRQAFRRGPLIRDGSKGGAAAPSPHNPTLSIVRPQGLSAQ